jgi:glyoxylase-like metal-dependent hydrolase (beta-lactamase superfamily II)
LTVASVLTGQEGPHLAPFTLAPDQALASLARLDGISERWVLPGHGEAWNGGLPEALLRIRAAATTMEEPASAA